MGDTNNTGNGNNAIDDTNNADVNTNNADSNSTNNSEQAGQEVDTEAFAELISEKDKRIEQLENDVKMLKKSNADLTVKISANNKSEVPIEQTIIDFCDTRKVK